MDLNNLLTPAETAKLLRIREATLAKWRSSGKGPYYLKPNGRCILYQREAVEEWLLGTGVAASAPKPEAVNPPMQLRRASPSGRVGRLGRHKTQADNRAEMAAASNQPNIRN